MNRHTIRRRTVSAAIAVIILATGAAAHAAEGASPLADRVREANDRLRDVTVAVEEGYVSIPCATGIHGGAVGVHFVNPAYLDNGELDIARPEVVIYEPQPDGSLDLVAAKYISFEGPANLGGRVLSYSGEPNGLGLPPFYGTHVWAWRSNSRGTFADVNPDVSCDAA